MENRTTIQIPKRLRDLLRERKKYKRETYEEIIERLILEQNRKLKQEIKKIT